MAAHSCRAFNQSIPIPLGQLARASPFTMLRFGAAVITLNDG